MVRLRRHVFIIASMAAALALLLLVSGVAGLVSREPAWMYAAVVMLTVLLVFLCGGILHVWRLARRYLGELEDALVQLREARAAADEANQAKSRFLATVSHELRTPLNGVLGMTGLLLDTPLTEAQKSYAEVVDVSARSLLSIIDELLDAARNDASTISVSIAPTDLVDCVESVMELMSPRAHAKGIELGSFISPLLPHRVVADAKRLRQVLLNLVGNAIKFTADGGVIVRVEPAERSGTIRIEVRDTGFGIPSDELDKVFDQFVQSSLPQAMAGRGSGLGLSISRQLVELMGGSICVRSVVGAGSSFIVELPLPEADLEASPESLERIGSMAGTHAVIAMPNGISREVLSLYLHAYGAEVHWASAIMEIAPRLEAAAAAAGDGPKPLLLLDASLCTTPDELARLASGYAVQTANVWTLLRPEERRQYRELLEDGRFGYLLKPARRSTLVQQLGRYQGTAADHPAKELHKVALSLRRAQSPAGKKVLLVEDNHINMLLATKILTSAGHSVQHLATGEAAVNDVRHNIIQTGSAGYDVILMDIQMPGMDGLEATRHIRAMERDAAVRQAVPILALSANSSSDDHAAGAGAGMDGYLAKPFDRTDLEAAIAGLTQASDAA
jgi:signal transduction histidine kinase/CheY-like chemotaxis protein